MAWKRTTFEIETDEGKETVTGLTRKGLGLHRVAHKPDGSGRGIWHVVHLKSGIAVLILNMWTEDNAVEMAELVVDLVKWKAFRQPADITKAHPDWMARLAGIKHTLPDDWMELTDPAMNDPARIVWYDPNGPRQ